MTTWAFPKPARPERSPKRLRQRAPLKRRTAIRSGVESRDPKGRKTKHARRQREWGRMAFGRSMGCDVVDALCTLVGEVPEAVWALRLIEPCGGPPEYMHLGDRAGYRRCPDAEGACGCRRHHLQPGIDGNIGGKAKWFRILGDDGQRALRGRLIERQKERWEALSVDQRATWEVFAEADRAAWRARRALDRAAG